MKRLLVVALTLISGAVRGQDLLAGVDSIPPRQYTIATFKGTRVINLHSVETLAKGTLEVRVAHRFGSFSSGANNLWGLDGPATIQIRLDYAPADRLNVGIGRSSDQKVIDGFLKYKIFRQAQDGSMPISMTGLFTANVTTMPNNLAQDRYQLFSSRMFYLASLIVARKFNSNFSLQLSPIYTHFNIVDNLTDKNDIFSLSGALRYKFSKRAAFTLEYIRTITPYTADKSLYNDVLGIGVDIETGGHVFQILVTNAFSINEARTIAYTTTNIQKGLMLGFNLSRVFTVRSR